MRSPYLPIPTWLTGLDLFALVAIPVWLIGSGIVRWLFRVEPPPRAIFDVSADTFAMTLYAQESGEKSSFDCQRKSVVEFRKNRLERGLWIHVKGVSMETHLQDVDDATIESLSEVVRDALGMS